MAYYKAIVRKCGTCVVLCTFTMLDIIKNLEDSFAQAQFCRDLENIHNKQKTPYQKMTLYLSVLIILHLLEFILKKMQCHIANVRFYQHSAWQTASVAM